MKTKTGIVWVAGLLCSVAVFPLFASTLHHVVVTPDQVSMRRTLTPSGPATVVWDFLTMDLDLPADLLVPGGLVEIDVTWQDEGVLQYLSSASDFQRLYLSHQVGDASLATSISQNRYHLHQSNLEIRGRNVVPTTVFLDVQEQFQNDSDLVGFELKPPSFENLVIDTALPGEITGLKFSLGLHPLADFQHLDTGVATIALSTFQRLSNEEAAAMPPMLSIQSGTDLPGDYNADGFVSQGDLDLVLLNWGDAALPQGWYQPGGFDGSISQNELDGVLLNWGEGSSAISQVPEPSAAVGLMMFAGWARRSRFGQIHR